MSASRGFASLGLIFVLVIALAVLGGAGWWAVKHRASDTSGWHTYASTKFEIQFKYPDVPYKLSTASDFSRGIIQVYVPPGKFGITVQIAPTPYKDLNELLGQRDEDTGLTFYEEYSTKPSGYVASTTIDGVSALETGIDCEKARHIEGPNYLDFSHPLEVIIIRKGFYYSFGASDICVYPQGVATFRAVLSGIRFLP